MYKKKRLIGHDHKNFKLLKLKSVTVPLGALNWIRLLSMVLKIHFKAKEILVLQILRWHTLTAGTTNDVTFQEDQLIYSMESKVLLRMKCVLLLVPRPVFDSDPN